MIEGVVYRYVSPEGKSYVGQTTNESRRKKEFKRMNINYRNKELKSDVEKYGAENFKYEVLFCGQYNSKKEAQAELYRMEEFYIQFFDSYNNGYNQTIGGDGVKGYKPSKEQVEKQRQWLIDYYKTHDNPFKGMHHSDEVRRILSDLAKMRTGEMSPMYGKHLSDEQKKILSECAKLRTGEKNPFFNKSHSEKTKRRISEANSRAVCQVDPITDEVIMEFSSAMEAGKSLGNPRLNSEIVKCCKGYISPSGRRYLTCKGYKWKYKEQ